ncbi:LysR family transcriptional regulator [Candidatus Entotheonella serta]|nr:LysR family transcriptional regulator [Candidatus Entotheonella serta]
MAVFCRGGGGGAYGGRAAERLAISQSPLSRQIRQLESILGIRLFARERQRIRLTTDGKQLLREAQALLAHAERVEYLGHRLATGEAGELAIGFVDGAIWNPALPRLMQALRREAPNVNVSLTPLSSGEQLEQLASGKLDIGFVHHRQALDTPHVKVRQVASEPFRLALPEDHTLAATKCIHPKDLERVPWIAPGQYFRQVIEDAFRKKGVSLCVGGQTLHFAAAFALILSLSGFALIQDSLRHTVPSGIGVRELASIQINIDTYMIWVPRYASRLVHVVDRLCQKMFSGDGEQWGKKDTFHLRFPG